MSNKAETNTTTNTMKDDSKREFTPRLRFPRFRDEWINTPLKEFATVITEKAGEKKCTLLSVASGIGLISQTEKFGRNIAGSQYKNYLLLRRNDFAYNKSATKAYPQGFIAKYSGDELGAVPNSIFTCFSVRTDKIDPEFLNYQFLGNIHGKWVRKYMEVSARAHGSLSISDDDLLALPVPRPGGESSMAEQHKIAECLTSLNELIAACNQNLDALKTHKTGLIQQLFPREGETIPRLRFPEFQNGGLWAGKKLGEIGDVLMCKRIFAEETNRTGDVPFYKIGTLGGKPDAFISRGLFEEYKSTYNYPRKGELLITCSGTVGKCLPFDGDDAYYQDSNIVWIDNPMQEVSNEFLLRIFINVDWNKLNTNTITRIYGPDLRNLVIRFPVEKAEQQRISGCLSVLDELTTAQTRKIEALNDHKKGLMQQLFPSAEDVEG